MQERKKNKQFGFTLLEVVVSIGILAILVGVVFSIYTLIINQVALYRDKTTVSYLAGQYMEIARNLAYSKIGTTQGNPHGDLPDLPNALILNFGGNNYKVYYSVSYVDDPADGTALAGTDPAPTDYKQIKLYINNAKTNVTTSFLTNVAPKGLEGLIGGGALVISVINAVGQPVAGANINIVNTQTNPTYNLLRTSDANGNWIEVGLPGSANSYHIVVSKNGYSSDQTYPISDSNPNPIKPDSTILAGRVTQVSFSIDLFSSLHFSTLNQTCVGIGNVVMGIKGAKLIGTPNVLKFNNSYTSDSNGRVLLDNLEWDTYTPGLANNNYMIYGSFPIQQVDLMPNTSQNFRLILGPATPYSMLVIVKDASTGNMIEGANVNLKSTNVNFYQTKITGGSVWGQQDWSLGNGQEDFADSAKYLEDDGNISNNIIPLGLRLVKIGSDYVSSGSLMSSTFDTGTEETIYTTLTWQPTSQDPTTFVKFQIATNNDKETWSFTGPDGTADSYYEVPGTTISFENNNKRYVRYKVFLSTNNISKTPVLTSVNVNYVSGCNTPGQVIFTGLDLANDYVATVDMAGYLSQIKTGINVDGYKLSEFLLSK